MVVCGLMSGRRNEAGQEAEAETETETEAEGATGVRAREVATRVVTSECILGRTQRATIMGAAAGVGRWWDVDGGCQGARFQGDGRWGCCARATLGLLLDLNPVSNTKTPFASY